GPTRGKKIPPALVVKVRFDHAAAGPARARQAAAPHPRRRPARPPGFHDLHSGSQSVITVAVDSRNASQSGGGSSMPRTVTNPPCPIGRAVEVLGDRWTLLIMRNATHGTPRFDGVPGGWGMPANVLS